MTVLFRSDVGDVWALCNDGLARWNHAKLAWEKHTKHQEVIGGVLECAFLGDTVLLNNRHEALHAYNWRTREFMHDYFPLPERELSFRQINNRLFLWHRTGSRLWKLANARLTALKNWPAKLPVVVSEGDSTPQLGLWLACDQGLMLRLANGDWQRLNSDWATDAVVDSEGTLWVSTRDRGVQRYVRNGIRHVPVEADIRRIAIDRGGALVLGAAEGKVLRCNATGVVQSVQQYPITFEIENIYIDTLEQIRAEHSRFYHKGCVVVDIDRSGNMPPRLWDAAHGLMLLNDVPSASIVRYQTTVPIPFSDADSVRYADQRLVVGDKLMYRRVIDMCIGFKGQWLLLASEDGLLRTTPQKIDTIRHPTGKPLMVRSLCRLTGNEYLLATYDQGLWIANDGTQLREIRTGNGEPLQVLKVEGMASKALLVTTDGLQLYDSSKDELSRVLSIADGLLKSDVKALALRKHGAWLATTQGLTWVPFSAFERELALQPLTFDGARKDGLPIHPSSLKALPHDLNTLDFAVHRTTLRYADRLQLNYRLVGRSDSWQTLPQGESELQLLGLKPGRYHLQIRSEVRGDPATADVLDIHFQIRPAWWNTWWFWLTLVVGLLALATVIYQYRERRIRQRAALDAKLAEAELSALRAQMNPHFMFNALNSLQAAIMKADKLRAMRLLKTFAGLLRTTVDYARASYIPLRIEIEQLERFIELQESRFSDALHIDFRLPSEGRDRLIPAMFIIPFVENAFEHGLRHKRSGEKRLLIALEWRSASQLHEVIEDNGIGREAAMAMKARQQLHKSVGLLSVRERLALYNQPGRTPMALDIQDLTHPDGSPAGTRIELLLPTEPAASSLQPV